MRDGSKTGNLYAQAVLGKAEIISKIKTYKSIAGKFADMKHCAACIATDFFNLTTGQWNGKKGAEYYAAILAAIVHFDLYTNN